MNHQNSNQDVSNLYDSSIQCFRDGVKRLLKLMKSANIPTPTHEELTALFKQLGIKNAQNEALTVCQSAQE